MIRVENIKKYFVNKKIVDLRFMTLSLDSLLNTNIPAGLHPRDKTGRVQIVSNELNLKYYKLIKEFYKYTSIPVILNTSFNVKGQPIVNTPTQAIDTFLGTNIDILVIGDYILKK